MKKALRNIHVKAIAKMTDFIKKENGDTNFISILIILGIVILLAGVFMLFKDQIITMVTDIVDNFTIH